MKREEGNQIEIIHRRDGVKVQRIEMNRFELETKVDHRDYPAVTVKLTGRGSQEWISPVDEVDEEKGGDLNSTFAQRLINWFESMPGHMTFDNHEVAEQIEKLHKEWSEIEESEDE